MARLIPIVTWLLASILATAAFATPPLWQPLPQLPVGIAGFGVTVSHGSVVVAGGTTWDDNQKTTLAARWCWSPGTDVWVPLAPLPRAMAHGAFAVYGAGLVLAGGSDGTATQQEIMIMDSAGGVRVAGALREPLAYAGAAIRSTTLYVLGGTPDIGDLSQLRASFHAVDLRSKSEEILPAYPAGPVMHARLAVIGERILAFPGGTYDAALRRASNLAAVWSFDIGSQRWSPRRPYPFAVRGLAICALDGDRHVLLAGGYRTDETGIETRMTAECFVYDAHADSYHALPPLPYAAMLMEAVRDDEWVYVLGGEDRSRHRATHAYRARIAEVLAWDRGRPAR